MGFDTLYNNTTKYLVGLAAALAAVIMAAAAFSVNVSALFVIDNLDKPSRWGGTCAPENKIVYQGKGALRLDSADYGAGGILCLAQKQFDPIDLSEYADGYIRFYLYVENEDTLGDASQFELTSSGTCDVEELTCNINTLDLHRGWNELIYSIAELRGAIQLDKVNFIRLYMFQTGAQTLVLDNISVGSAADFGIGEVAVKEKTVLTLDNCDSAAGYTYGSGETPAVYTEIKVEGVGAVGAQTGESFTLTKNFDKPLDISAYVKSGYIYFWLYIENADTLANGASLALRSSDKDMVAWSINGLKKGWNELLLKFSGTTIGSGAIDFTRLNRITLTVGNNGANLFAVDNILYGYSRDFGIKNDDDPPAAQTAQTDVPAKVTSSNAGVYAAVTVFAALAVVCAALPLAVGFKKTKTGEAVQSNGGGSASV